MKLGHWVKLEPPVLVRGEERHYGKVVGHDTGGLFLQFPRQVRGERFPGLPGKAPTEADVLWVGMRVVREVPQRPENGIGPSIGGMKTCRSNSLESGGSHAWCTCDGCF